MEPHPNRSSALESPRERDLETVRQCLAGDREVFGDLVERWQDRVFGAIFRMVRDRELARDLSQETFLRAFSKLESFKGGAAFGTWLYSIAVNQVRSEMRKRSAAKNRPPLSLDALRGGREDGPGLDPADPDPDAPERAGMKEDCALLLDEIANLDPDHKEVIVLREFQDLSYDEIAEVTGVPVGTVRSRLHRARGDLRERLRGRVL